MAERRISGWFVLSAVFIVAVFGLFFTFTERKTWPEQRIELSATDMRMVPPSSTLWCEAVALYSDHPFVAYQVNQTPFINPTHLNKQRVNFNIRLNGGRVSNSIKLKYYLLPSSIVEIYACATFPGGRLLVFKGKEDVQSLIQNLSDRINKSESPGSDSSEDSSDQEEVTDSDSSSFESIISQKNSKIKNPTSLISYNEISVNEEENVIFSCEGSGKLQTIQVNVTDADFYTFVLLNTNRQRTNHFGLRMTFDRSRYTIHKSGQTFDMCSLSTSCTIGLSFASKDRALVWIPDEPNAGRSTFVVRSQCRPRLAVFAILSVFFPLIVFLAVAFVVRADKERIMRIYQCSSRNRQQQAQCDRRFAAPLLDDRIAGSNDFIHCPAEVSDLPALADEQPPPYHTLYDPPPPYACVKTETAK